MKKFILLSLFLILTLTGFAQQRGNVFIVPTYTTNFTMSLPIHTFVYCIDSAKTYRLRAIGQPTKNLSNTPNIGYPTVLDSLYVSGNVTVDGNLSVNDTLFWNTIYPTPFDSTHCWSKLYTDSLSSCSPLVIYSNDTSYYTALGHKFNSNVDADSYINTDSSYYLKGIEFIKANHNLGNQFIGVGSGMNNIVDSINYPLGSLNTANGAYSLYGNTTGSSNVANGYQSLYSNTTGNSNTANGAYSLYSNTEGYNNIANGAYSLYSNTEGYNNIANGAYSLYSNTTGSSNIAIGNNSGNLAHTAANGLLWIGEGDYNNAIIYGNMLTDSLRLNGTVLIRDVPLSTSDSVLVMNERIVSHKILDMSLYPKFADTTSTILTQLTAAKTYQLKYWSKTGTAIQPYISTDTVIAPFIRLKNIHTTGTVLTEVTSTGLLDTIATTPINPIYVKKAGDTMGGSLIMNSGSILFDDYAFASGDKVAIIHESGLLDTATTVRVDNAVINTLTISDSIRIGGLWYIGDTAIIADEDSIIIPVNKSMFGQIFVDSLGYMVAYANSFYVDINGTPHLISNSSRVIATNTDTNAICLYAYAGNLILRNRSGSTLKYKIILNG